MVLYNYTCIICK